MARSDGELVGREAEERLLDALLERARAGESQNVLITGEPGIGKTSLGRMPRSPTPDCSTSWTARLRVRI